MPPAEDSLELFFFFDSRSSHFCILLSVRCPSRPIRAYFFFYPGCSPWTRFTNLPTAFSAPSPRALEPGGFATKFLRYSAHTSSPASAASSFNEPSSFRGGCSARHYDLYEAHDPPVKMKDVCKFGIPIPRSILLFPFPTVTIYGDRPYPISLFTLPRSLPKCIAVLLLIHFEVILSVRDPRWRATPDSFPSIKYCRAFLSRPQRPRRSFAPIS